MSYSRADREIAERVILGLRGLGVDVWWDEDMRGVDWQQELHRQINELSAVMVLWTEHSSNSNNVRDEARLGLNAGKLVNILSGVPEPPFPFDRINGLPIGGWTGRADNRGWARLVETIDAILAGAGQMEAGAVMGVLRRQERELRDLQAEVVRATTAFQETQTRESECVEEVSRAGEVFAQVEAQYEQVVGLRPSATLLRAAEQELEAARAGRDGAQQALREARKALSEASRAMSRAEARLETAATPVAADPVAKPKKSAPSQPAVATEAIRVEVAPSKPATTPSRAPQPAAKEPDPPIARRSSGSMILRWSLIAVGVLVGLFVVLAIIGSFIPDEPAKPGGDVAATTTNAAPSPEMTAAAAMAGRWRPADAAGACDAASAGIISLEVKDGALHLVSGDYQATGQLTPLKAGGWLELDGGLWRLSNGRLEVVQAAGARPVRYAKCA